MQFPENLLNKIKNSPKSPGCYIFKNDKGKILYIGKAVNIRNRVSSYFSNYHKLDPKIALLIDEIKDTDFFTTDTDLEALILETNLIKKYKPKYNRMMKDDKNYTWLMITKTEDYPKVNIVREQKKKSADYFGPFSNPAPIRRALKQLRKIFPYRSCNREMYYFVDKNNKTRFYCSDYKPCLYYHMNLCNAPCTGKEPKTKYRKNVNNIKRFFRNRKFEIIDDLSSEMKKLSQKRKYEEAAVLKSKLEDLTYLAQRIRVEKDMDEQMWLKKKEESSIEATKKLISKLRMKNLEFRDDFRMECFDISNISGKSATGSMVVFIDGKPSKKNYRKFKIKTKEEPDDYEMLREVFIRRFKKKKSGNDNSFKSFPNLIIVDGGKGQLSATLKVLDSLKLRIPTIGLAKKEEEIFKFENNRFKKVKLRKPSEELFLIQKIRDEAHRFAIKYHKILRSKKQVKSVLDDIPGVGEIVRKRLLKAFGSAENIKKASFDDLQNVVKNRQTVENIRKLL